MTLPWPPSTNAIWRAYKGRNIVSKAYREWKRLAADEVALQRPAKLSGPYSMVLTLYPPDKRRRDLSNHIKATEDILTSCGVITDDSLAQIIVLQWGDKPVTGGLAVIELEEWK